MHQRGPGEASLTANPGGQFLYAVWAQAQITDDELVESDAMHRRGWWVDDFFPVDAWVFGQGTGGGGGTDPGDDEGEEPAPEPTNPGNKPPAPPGKPDTPGKPPTVPPKGPRAV